MEKNNIRWYNVFKVGMNMKKLKLKKNMIIVGVSVIALIALVIGGFSLFGKEENDVIEKIKDKVTTPKKELKIVDLKSDSRPYAVMINNIGVARPLQSGLQDAYIVYEMVVEGGLTRYMALFLDQETERIGSIRSSRHYYLDYALENDAIYVHHGQSPQALSDFSKLGVDRVEVSPNKTGWRDKSLNVSSEHTLFTSIEKLGNGMKNKRTEREKDLLLNYSVDEIDLSKQSGATEANNVSIKYSSSVTSSYEYDAENKVYKRSVNGKAHKDYVTSEQYTFKNIIAYDVNNYNLNDSENKGRQGIDNIGSGTGYYISNGYAIKITWEKSSRESQTIYRYFSPHHLHLYLFFINHLSSTTYKQFYF